MPINVFVSELTFAQWYERPHPRGGGAAPALTYSNTEGYESVYADTSRHGCQHCSVRIATPCAGIVSAGAGRTGSARRPRNLTSTP
ncbi:hypothetical protein R1CP_39820 (plasmid) [Rhodococcus opacus]|uniref:Uncharacterized protein n=1 Tax=Rhodococcus opacus TaxID=37919 RepID=A0A1B1KIX5_RHOOP|nr:hypothetical protein R1CP_39820 [Rhodococcus opacus]